LNSFTVLSAFFLSGGLPGAILGLVGGTFGVLYGLRAKEFIAYGFYGFTSKQQEKISPRWYHRLAVILIASTVLLGSLRAIVKNL